MLHLNSIYKRNPAKPVSKCCFAEEIIRMTWNVNRLLRIPIKGVIILSAVGGNWPVTIKNNKRISQDFGFWSIPK